MWKGNSNIRWSLKQLEKLEVRFPTGFDSIVAGERVINEEDYVSNEPIKVRKYNEELRYAKRAIK